LRIGIGMARMSTLCHKSLSLASYIVYGNALANKSLPRSNVEVDVGQRLDLLVRVYLRDQFAEKAELTNLNRLFHNVRRANPNERDRPVDGSGSNNRQGTQQLLGQGQNLPADGDRPARFANQRR